MTGFFDVELISTKTVDLETPTNTARQSIRIVLSKYKWIYQGKIHDKVSLAREEGMTKKSPA